MQNLLPIPFDFDCHLLNGIDTKGKWLLPPLVDLGVQLQSTLLPDSLSSESHAAYHNGFLHVVVRPDGAKILDNGAAVAALVQALETSGMGAYALGAMSAKLQGKIPTDMHALLDSGAVGVSNAWAQFSDDDALLQILTYAKNISTAKSVGATVFFYPHEATLAKNGVMHDGFVATYHGLAGISVLAETVALAKQLLLTQQTGIRAHFGCLSCQESVELIRHAKARGLPVTCDVAMHQLHLTENITIGFNALGYVLPPLRSDDDRRALLVGLADGTIDAICSHHEPLPLAAKCAPFAECCPGISALDTFMALGCKLVTDGVLTLTQLVQKIAINPAKIAGIDEVYQQRGGAVLVDPHLTWQVCPDSLLSQGKNTPFIGSTLRGKVERVFFA